MSKAHADRIHELRRLVRKEEEDRLAQIEEAEGRVPHQPHPIIWLEPRCSSCGSDKYGYERFWSKDNMWESGCKPARCR
jgi:hypothetical protein